jgi:hypothetical protein
VPTRWAAAYWREQTKAGIEKPRNVVHTSSTSGLLSNPGQTNYGAAKSGIATFSQICAKELTRYGVKSNCIAPAARTRLTEATPGLGEIVKAPEDAEQFDIWDPANISPLVAYLASADCAFNGETFFVQGGSVKLVQSWTMAAGVERDDRWTVAELTAALKDLGCCPARGATTAAPRVAAAVVPSGPPPVAGTKGSRSALRMTTPRRQSNILRVISWPTGGTGPRPSGR